MRSETFRSIGNRLAELMRLNSTIQVCSKAIFEQILNLVKDFFTIEGAER